MQGNITKTLKTGELFNYHEGFPNRETEKNSNNGLKNSAVQ
jgi:hypothetical protein